MPDQLEAAPQLRSWTRQGIDVSQLLAAAINAVASADIARQAAITAQAAADAAVAALNLIGDGGSGGTGNGLITPTSIQGSTQVGRDLLVAPGNTYTLQQASARSIIGAPAIGTGANDAAPGTLTASVASLANRVTALENSGVGGVAKDNIDIDTDGVPIWND